MSKRGLKKEGKREKVNITNFIEILYIKFKKYAKFAEIRAEHMANFQKRKKISNVFFFFTVRTVIMTIFAFIN